MTSKRSRRNVGETSGTSTAIGMDAGRSVAVAVALAFGIGGGFDCSGGNGASTRFTSQMVTRE